MAGIPSKARPVFLTDAGRGVRVGQSTGDYALDVALGLVDGLESRAVFGENPDNDSGSEAIWTRGGLPNFLSSGQQLFIVSDNAGDSGELRIELLDDEFNLTIVTASLDGQTPVSIGPADGFRVNCFETNDTNGLAGIAYAFSGTATAGTPDDLTKILAQMTSPQHSCLSTIFTIPKGKKGFITRYFVMEQISANAQVFGLINYKVPGQNLKELTRFAAKNTGNGYIEGKTSAPKLLPSGTDIHMNARVNAANTIVNGGYDLFLADV